MNFDKKLILLFFIVGSVACNPFKEQEVSLTPVPFNQVKLEDSFWLPRLDTQYKELVPFALDKTRPAVENLRRAANYLKEVPDEKPFAHRYISSDLFKVMEGVSYILMDHEDPKLEKRMDEIIDVIEGAQKEDGYLYVAHTTGVDEEHPSWGGAGMGDEPYSWVLHSHELYNMGHMYEAAIAYFRATGKDQWLKVAEKNARHVNKVFFEGDPNYNDGEPVNQAPGHQEIELALVKLYRLTGEQLYLNMAEQFLDIRGKTFKPEGEGVMSATYAQQHAPVEDQKEAKGHAVRAAYMYTAMADVEALKGKNKYDKALNSIWHDIVDTKMHITGGLGATHGIEGFGPKYVLPNEDTYNETCAAVGNVFFNYRMFLNNKDARYLDVAEVALYNNALAGVNLEGNRFFYVNPLEADGETPFNHGKAGRSPWFNTACCPSNIARLIPQVPGMMYAHTPREIFATFYGSSSTTIPLEEGKVRIIQRADYPFEGHIAFTLNPGEERRFTFNLRIPTWARGRQFVPGELYNYVNTDTGNWMVSVNGERLNTKAEKGFVAINRRWKSGDRVELSLPMETKFNMAIDSVENNKNRIAVTRGPLVYSAEGIDNEVEAQQLYINPIPTNSEIESERFKKGKLHGIMKLQMTGAKITGNSTSKTKLTLVPYYSWNNRGNGSMRVWFPRTKDLIK